MHRSGINTARVPADRLLGHGLGSEAGYDPVDDEGDEALWRQSWNQSAGNPRTPWQRQARKSFSVVTTNLSRIASSTEAPPAMAISASRNVPTSSSPVWTFRAMPASPS